MSRNGNKQDFACPSCGDTARVNKVSVVVATGTSTGTFTGSASSAGYAYGKQGGYMSTAGYASLTGTQRTTLSETLARPLLPIYVSPYGIGTKIAIGFLVFALLIIVIASIALIGVNPSFAGGLFVWNVLLYGGILALLLLFKNRTAKRRKAQYEADMAEYQEACRRWDKLYYCSLHDVVFIPGEPDMCAPSSEISELIKPRRLLP